MNTITGTESYVSMFLSMPNVDASTVLSVFFLTLARLIPIVSLAPFIGSKNTPPAAIKIGFSLALIAIFLPNNLLAIHQEVHFNFAFMGYFLKELAIGFVLGFLAMIPFLMAQMAGSLVDFQRGASSLQVSDPTTQTQTGPVGMLANLILIAIFYGLDGPFLYFNGLADSYRLIPVDGIMNADLFGNNQIGFWKQIYGLAGMMMNIAVQLASPALIGILLTDLFLGIANRLAPQVQIVFLGIALKSWVGIALLTAAWGLMLQVMGKQSIEWFQALNVMIRSIGETYVKHAS